MNENTDAAPKGAASFIVILLFIPQLPEADPQ